jgi:type VI secretion system protein ImpK
MPEQSQNSYPLLREFRAFYIEAARLRVMARDAALVSPGASPVTQAPGTVQPPTALQSGITAPTGSQTDASQPSAPATVGAVWQAMAEYLDQKLNEVKHSYVAGSVYYDVQFELVYIMAALADEIFLQLEWSGKAYWLDHLMEQHLFHTQIAGQEIFRRIDEVVDRQAFGAGELAAVYLIALALGFKGKYYRHEDRKTLEDYRKKLLHRVLWSNPELQQGSQQMFPEAYQHTVLDGAPVKLPEPRTWWLVVAGIVAAWLILSTIAWVQLTRPTRDRLAETTAVLNRVNNSQAGTCDQCAPAKQSEIWWLALTGLLAVGLFLFTAWLFRFSKARRQFTIILSGEPPPGNHLTG